MVGTWLMMRRFMDGSRRRLIWASGVVTACLFFLVPAIPVAVEVAQIPTMPAAVRANLEAEAKQILGNVSNQSRQSVMLIKLPSANWEDLTAEEALKLFAQRFFSSGVVRLVFISITRRQQ